MTNSESTTPAPAPHSAQLPTIGRIVHFVPDSKGKVYPAIVTHVFNKDTVNLCVFQDGSQPTTDLTPTSVVYSAVSHARSWHWPPR